MYLFIYLLALRIRSRAEGFSAWNILQLRTGTSGGDFRGQTGLMLTFPGYEDKWWRFNLGQENDRFGDVLILTAEIVQNI